MPRCLFCYITDRAAFPGDEPTRRRRLLSKIAEAARARVDYIQLREKDLPARDLESLATDAIALIRPFGTALHINSRTDVGIAAGVDGVHLPSDDISPVEARRIWDSCPKAARITISVSCHSPSEVHQAALSGADLALFAPVFEKKNTPTAKAVGLDALRQACQHRIPVLALGGVAAENAAACLDAGAAGIAGIRLFQDHDIAELVRRIRGL